MWENIFSRKEWHQDLTSYDGEIIESEVASLQPVHKFYDYIEHSGDGSRSAISYMIIEKINAIKWVLLWRSFNADDRRKICQDVMF